MTLLEIVNFVCSKHGKSDDTTKSFLKDATRRMYEFVWQYAPWQDTLTYSTYSVTAGNRTVTLGSTVEVPLAVAYGDEEVQAVDLNWIFRTEPDLLDSDRYGTPLYYVRRPRSTAGVAALDLYPYIEAGNATETLKVLEKLKVKSLNTSGNLAADSDSPAISGVDNVLISLVEGEFLQRERQYQKAAAVKNEAVAELSNMASLELNQGGATRRIVPAGLGEYSVGDWA